MDLLSNFTGISRETMVNKILTQSPRNVFQHQSHPSNRQRPRGGVRQEGRSHNGALAASSPVSLSPKELSALALNRKLSRSQNPNVVYQKKPKVTMRINPLIHRDLLRKAKEAGIPHSVAAAVIFERAMQLDVDMQYGALLEPVLQRGMAKNLREEEKQTLLLARLTYEVGQIRGMVTNILGRTQGVNQEILTTIIKESGNSALANITRSTPQVREIMMRLEKWLSETQKRREQ